jgi:DNA replication protein DnaC
MCEKCNDIGYTFTEIDGYLTSKMCSCQREKTIESILKSSGITYEEYQSKTLESFKTENKMAAEMKSMAEKFIADKKATGIGYFGKSGTGKTHICIAICNELTKKRLLLHRYFSYRTDIQKIKACYYDLDMFNHTMGKYLSCDVLFIDDLFKFATNKDGGIQTQDLQIMFDIINTRYLNKSITIFSSELTVEEIRKIDEALGSRIYAMIQPYGVKCIGENMRFKG